MSPEEITQIMRHTFLVALEIGTPLLVLVMVVGLLISLLQSVTHIQEMTLSFVPKMLVLAGALAILFPWMLKIMSRFASQLLIYQWEKVLVY